MIGNIWPKFFEKYKKETGKTYLKYVTTCTDRPGDPEGSPHKIPGNALDFTLRSNNDYSGMNEYKDLMKYMFNNWKYRAGADLTPKDGNVHIHLDLGLTKITSLPYFFIENNGRWVKEIESEGDIV